MKGRLNLAVNDLGTTQLKDVPEPIRVYSLEVGVAAGTKAVERESAAQENFLSCLSSPINHRLPC